MKKQLLILFAFISVLALSQVPQRFNKVIVTGDITSPKFIKTGSNSDSVLLGNGSARSVNSLKTDTVNLSNRINAKATGNGTANGTNTGDETLTSIKTKLGAATAVSDGYLKYQDWIAFNSKEPAITKNTAFNKNFGTTPGTVLEGRTFGTSANSAVGDFIRNQTSSPQSANMWINGSIKNGDANNSFSLYNQYLSFVNRLVFESRDANDNGGFIFRSTGDLGTNKDVAFLNNDGTVFIPSTIASTSPTTGALVVSGGIGADHMRANNFYGNGSNLTGVQLPITLTTNGTSGAATLSGNVLNVPNYNTSSDVYQERTTVNGSTSGYMICSMPFRTGVYKKVLIRTNGLNGSATYTFPTSFLVESGIGPYYSIHTTGGSVTVSSFTRTSITLSSAVDFSAYIVVEGF